MNRLVKPSIEFKEDHMAFLNEWENDDVTPYSIRLLGKSYEEWLEHTKLFEKRETTPSKWVPASTYFLINEEGRILGAANIRHELNDYLTQFGGHIGYGVRPSERKKGYATELLRLSLDVCREMGLSEVLVTCDDDNIGSKKTIEKNGGTLEDSRIDEEGNNVLRYWIKL